MTEQCYFSANNIKHLDYKNVELIKKFLNPHARILAKKRGGICGKHQRMLAQAVKRARFMALIPYIAR